MKRGVFDVLRRALDNTLANWPLIGIRLAETVIFFLITIAAVLAIVVPILVSVGLNLANMTTPDDVVNAMFNLGTKWVLLLWVLLGVGALLFVFVAMHAFVEAGSARVYVDAERVAGPAVEGARSRFNVFSMERWLAGGRDGWWTLFWVYNIAWTIASAILLVPLLPTFAIMYSLQDAQPGMAAATGCLGLLLTLLLFFLVAIVTSIWVNRAIADWAVRRAGARDALAAGWAAVKGDFGRLFLIALAVFVVAMAGSTFFAGFSFFAAFGGAFSDSPTAMLMMLPIRFIATLCSSAFSAAVSSWFLAAYSSVAVER
ncbi:MAG TPA: hypothetical protein VE974_09570 [Thermoanaerobaculia bacterium]|nr:hypothetical protein [Thermoanaerobaculia bacterium]